MIQPFLKVRKTAGYLGFYHIVVFNSGWKTRTSKIKTKAGMTEMQWFLSPEGKMFRGRKSMLKFIQSNPDRFHPEALRKFKSVPTQNKKFSAEYDWNENDPTMPEGIFFINF